MEGVKSELENFAPVLPGDPAAGGKKKGSAADSPLPQKKKSTAHKGIFYCCKGSIAHYFEKNNAKISKNSPTLTLFTFGLMDSNSGNFTKH